MENPTVSKLVVLTGPKVSARAGAGRVFASVCRDGFACGGICVNGPMGTVAEETS
jgi:hypothetical protein